MRIIILLLLGTLPAFSHAQNDRWHVFHRTSALIHPNYPSQNLGVEFFPIPHKLSVTGEIGFIGAGKLSDELFVKSRKYYGELRYYIKEGANHLIFGGFSYQYRNTHIEDTYIIGFNCFSFDSRDCDRYMEYTGRLSSQLHSFQLILGSKSFISDWFYIDTIIGLGLGSHLLDRDPINDGTLAERGRFWQENSFGPEKLQINGALKVGLIIDRLLPRAKKQDPIDGG